MQRHGQRSVRTAELVEKLHEIVEELESMHPGRKFPLDGHLVGSIGEAAAEALFDIQLVPSSTTGHDAICQDGRRVEVKATYGTSRVAIRTTSHAHADSLIVLRLSRVPGTPHEVVYNGPFATAASVAGVPQSNGQAPISLSRLRSLNPQVAPAERIPTR